MTQAQRTVTLIGAQGRMGRMLGYGLASAGATVHFLDRPLTQDKLQAALPGSDIVILSVPIDAVNEVLENIAPHLGPDTILADICSVKTEPVRAMLQAHAGPVVGTHPLFGPSPEPGTPLRVAIVPARNDEAATAMAGLFRAMGHESFITSAEEHDRAMAYVQGLNFATTLAYLASAPQDMDIAKFLTPSFERRLEAARTMCTSDAGMFASMCEANPAMGEILRNFRSFLNIAAGGDLDLLSKRAGWWWQRNNDDGEPE
ncbi:MAG: prephenate dehydrogenase [Deltaproteobacteria bacterium]|nr:prephenate dehydrogenase [Deltaproteobacteria bacterium]